MLLPGVVALCATKVVSGYVSGLGMTGTNSIVNVGAFVLNIAANIVLIPLYGIVGAAAASLISYSVSSIVFTAIAARLSHANILDFWIPRPSDVRYVVGTSLGLARRVVGRRRRRGVTADDRRQRRVAIGLVAVAAARHRGSLLLSSEVADGRPDASPTPVAAATVPPPTPAPGRGDGQLDRGPQARPWPTTASPTSWSPTGRTTSARRR